MSWLARSIANSLRLDDEDDDRAAVAVKEEKPDDASERPTPTDRRRENEVYPEYLRFPFTKGYGDYDHGGNGDLKGDGDQGRGVKEDLSEIRDSLKRQFWDVASFLAPPPPDSPSRRSDSSEPVLKPDAGESDYGGSMKNEGSVDDEGESDQFQNFGNIQESEAYYNDLIDNAAGITEEVLAFARNIAHHPETWLDFPLLEEDEIDDFEISGAQYEHALAVELLAPRLAALRIELCPVHMTEGYFWMVYFVLLHSRLNKHDADSLSSPQLVQARVRWMQELQKQIKEDTLHLKESTISPHKYSPYEDSHNKIPPFEWSATQSSSSHEPEKQPLFEIKADDKFAVEEYPAPGLQEKGSVAGLSNHISVFYDNDDDDWVKEDSDLVGYYVPSVNEEDISFSDLEDDLDCTMPIKYGIASNKVNSNSKTL